MPEPVTVWAVETHLGPQDRKGTLSLEEEALRFAPATAGYEIRIALSDVTKARRLRGSPVLLVAHRADGRLRRTAFYFVQPPPLGAVVGREPPEQQEGPTLFPRNTRRRERRRNVGYLGLWSREKKTAVAAWEKAIREALARRGT